MQHPPQQSPPETPRGVPATPQLLEGLGLPAPTLESAVIPIRSRAANCSSSAHHRLLGSIGHVPPVEYEGQFNSHHTPHEGEVVLT